MKFWYKMDLKANLLRIVTPALCVFVCVYSDTDIYCILHGPQRIRSAAARCLAPQSPLHPVVWLHLQLWNVTGEDCSSL